jgi:hypothetical protein
MIAAIRASVVLPVPGLSLPARRVSRDAPEGLGRGLTLEI